MRIAAVLIPLFAVACSGANASKDDAGPAGTRSFSASGFERVKLAGSDDVRVVAGNDFSVEATGPQGVLDRLDIRVEGDTLHVGREKRDGWNWSSGKGAVITVTMPVMRGATLAGSGDFNVATTADDRFEGRVAGSGDLTIDEVRAAETKFSLAGSGDIRARGKAHAADYSIAGSGSIDAADLKSETLAVSVAGSGDVSAYATGHAEVRIVGSGDVTIAGTKDCKTRKMGSGEVRCV